MTEVLSRAARAKRQAQAGALGHPAGDVAYGVFALDARVVAEMISLPSAIQAGTLPTTQLPDGSLPWMADIDGIDEAELG